MKRTIILLIFMFAANAVAQESGKHEILKNQVYGIVTSGNSYFLSTDSGYVLINVKNNSDPWQEYYRKIYNDTTIQNPNTVLQFSDFDSGIKYFNPAVDLSQWSDKYETFGNKLYLYDFMELDENGNYTFKPGIIGLIQKEIKKEK